MDKWIASLYPEGPVYADRVSGKLTFRDWDGWAEEDRKNYAALRDERLKQGQ